MSVLLKQTALNHCVIIKKTGIVMLNTPVEISVVKAIVMGPSTLGEW